MWCRTSSILISFILIAISGAFCLAACPSADLTGDCFVDFNDFAVMADQWRPGEFNDVAVMANQWLTGDPFVGVRTIMMYGDDEISDGVIISSMEVTTITSKYNEMDYAIELVTGPTFSMARHGENQLALSPQPQDMGTWIAANVYMLSDGFNGAFLMVGKDSAPLDISIHVATWASEVEVSGSQLEGQWLIKWIYDDNLRDAYLSPFSFENEILTITDIGNGQVDVQIGDIDVVMNINGNRLEPVAPIDPAHVYFSAVTNGHGISVAWIGVETYDPTDVAARIGLAAPVQ